MQRSVKICTTVFTILIATANVGCKTPRNSMASKHPRCIETLIKKMSEEEVTNPPASLYSYTYYNRTVYFVPAPCCDFFSILYDDSCNVIAHPDGGFTGRGDGRGIDFFETRKDEVKIWQDKRE